MSPTASKSVAAWRPRGKRQGGTVTGISLSPEFARDRTVFAATMAGVYRSTDGGASWQPINNGLTSPFTISVAAAPTFGDEGLVLAGARAGGLYQSVNAGEEWHPVEIWGQRESVQAIAISPNFKRDQSALIGSETSGVFRTTTGGKSWSASNFGLLELGVLALAYSPNFAQDETAFVVTTDGFYRTPNGGRAWRETGDDLIGVALQCVALSPAFGEDNLIAVGSEDEGVYISSDGGRKWKKANKGLDDTCVNALQFSPDYAKDKMIVAGTNSGAYVSRDGGQSWQKSGSETGALLALAAGPGGLVLAGAAQGGIFRSTDGGQTWAEANEGLAARLFVQLAASPAFAKDKTLYSVSLDEGVSRSTDGGATWQPAGVGLEEREVTALAFAGATIFAATDGGVWSTGDGGKSWKSASDDLKDQAVRALTVSPDYANDKTVFAAVVEAASADDPAAVARLVISRDGGASWEYSRETFDGRDVVSIACSPEYATDRSVYAGTFREAKDSKGPEVAIWRSEDGGRSWIPLTSHNTPGRWIAIATTPSYARDRGVFVGVQSAVLRPMAGPLSAPLRPGRRQLWYAERIGRPNTAVVSLVCSPGYEKDHTLYAGTSDGAFVSRNGGLSWSALNEGLGNKSIVSLVLSPNFAEDGQIFAASLGGALWTFTEERAGAAAKA